MGIDSGEEGGGDGKRGGCSREVLPDDIRRGRGGIGFEGRASQSLVLLSFFFLAFLFQLLFSEATPFCQLLFQVSIHLCRPFFGIASKQSLTFPRDPLGHVLDGARRRFGVLFRFVLKQLSQSFVFWFYRSNSLIVVLLV